MKFIQKKQEASSIKWLPMNSRFTSLAYCARVLVKQERTDDEGFEANILSRRVCYKCGKEGHFAFECCVSWKVRGERQVWA